MATSDQVNSLTSLYVGYFDRAPDPAGLQSWINAVDAGVDIETIAGNFADSAEAKATYPYLETPGLVTPAAFVGSIYMNLFNRPAEPDGLNYWVDLLANGTISPEEMILEIIGGAQGSDQTILDNKIEAGRYFAETAASTAGYDYDISDAKAAIDGVTADEATVDAAKATTDAEVAGGANIGDTFTLTTGIDDLTGTGLDDVFTAPLELQDPTDATSAAQTLQTFDEISGGEGVDRLNARLIDSSADNVSIDGVENLFLRSSDDAATLNMSGVTGAEQVWSDRSTGDLAISEIQNGVVLGVTQGNGSDYTATYADDANGADFTQSVVLQNADIGTLSVTAGSGADDEITGLALNVTGTDAELVLAGDLVGISDLTVEGDAGLDISTTSLNDLETIASTTTGDVSVVAGDLLEDASFGEGSDTLETGGAAVVSIGMGAGDDEVSLTSDLVDGAAIDMADGDDRLDLGDNLDLTTTAGVLDTTVSLNGGAGVDTLAMASATAAAVSTDDAGFDAQFTNFEKLELGEVAANQTDVVDLSNMNDIDYVISAGTEAGAAADGTEEVAEFDFSGVTLLSGQSYTIGEGANTVTINASSGTLDGAGIADAFDTATAPTGYTSSATGSVVTFTENAVGDVDDLEFISSDQPDLPTVDVAETKKGVEEVTALPEIATVEVGGLIAGESVTVTDNEGSGDRTVTGQGVTETAVANFQGFQTTHANTAIYEINGLTITAEDIALDGTSSTFTAEEFAAAVADGTEINEAGRTLTVTGSLNGYTATNDGGGQVTFTSNVANVDALDISIDNSGTTPPPAIAPVITQGDDGNLSAAEVASALAGNAVNGAVVNTTATFNYAGNALGNVVTFTANTDEAKGDITASTTSGITPTVDVTQQGRDPVPGENEVQTVTFDELLDGQSVTVAGRKVTADGGDLSAAAVVDAFLTGINGATVVTGDASVSGTLAANWTIADGGNDVVFTSTNELDRPEIIVAVSNGDAPTVVTPTIIDGTATGPGGSLVLDEMASGGTLELTDALEGNATVNVTDAALAGSTNDVFNIRLNGTQQIANTAALMVANVETVNIETTNSDEDNLPTAASDLDLQAADAETVNVSGNHGIDFTGSDLSSMTLLDASGVLATETTPGADDAGDVGMVTIATGATDADVTILTGNGDDDIDANFVGTGFEATIDAGAGDDEVTGSEGDDMITAGEGADVVNSSAGADTITLGAGNDIYVLADTQDSVINTRDVIIDFSPNTVGQGAGGAATEAGAEADVEDRDGDVIDLSGLSAVSTNGVAVEVFANASDATTFLANNDDDDALNIALDSSTGFLYIDTSDDGIANSVIELTGVTTIDEAAFDIA